MAPECCLTKAAQAVGLEPLLASLVPETTECGLTVLLWTGLRLYT